MVLLVELRPGFFIKPIIADGMAEFMHADIASEIFILFQFEQIFFTAGGQPSAHAAGALIAGQPVIFRKGLAFVLTPLRQVGGDLVFPDDMELDFGRGEIGNDNRLMA